MIDEQFWSPVALVLATKAAEGLAEGGKSALSALVSLVRRGFAHRPSAEAALGAAQDNPDDPRRIETLRYELEGVAADDPEFAAKLLAAWHDVQVHLNARDSGVINQIVGAVDGNVVQARDVHGGISFGTR